jgi:hypothetical protein
VTKELNGVGWRAQSPRYGRNDVFTVFYDNGEWSNDICEGHIDTLMAALKAWKKSKREPEWAVKVDAGWANHDRPMLGDSVPKDKRMVTSSRQYALAVLHYLRHLGHTCRLVRVQ